MDIYRGVNMTKKTYSKNKQDIIIKNNILDENNNPESDEKNIEYQKQLSHFLNDYATRHNLSKTKMADLLGYTTQHYYRIHDGEDTRMSSAISYIKKYADVAQKSISDFVSYIASERPKERVNNISANEADLLHSFSLVDRLHRRKFIEKYCGEKNSKKFEKLIRCLSIMPDLDEDSLNLIALISFNLKKELTILEVNEKKSIINNLIQFYKSTR